MASPLQIIEELRAAIDATSQEALLVAHKDNASWRAVCDYAYNPDYKYPILPSHLVCDTVADGASLESPTKLFDLLRHSKRRNDPLLATVKRFIAEKPKLAGLVRDILGHDLKCGINATLLQKVYGGSYAPQDPNDDVVCDAPDFNVSGEWMATRRCPGILMAVMKHQRFVNFQGGAMLHREFRDQCRHIENEFIKITNTTHENKVPHEFVLLGRACLVVDGVETDVGLQEALDGKDIIDNLRFIAYDCFTIRGYCNGEQDDTLDTRIKVAAGLFERFHVDPNVVSVAKYATVRDNEHFATLMTKAAAMGWSKVELRKAGMYRKDDAVIAVEVTRG